MRIGILLVLALVGLPLAHAAGPKKFDSCEAAAKGKILDELELFYGDVLQIPDPAVKAVTLSEFKAKIRQMVKVFGEGFAKEVVARLGPHLIVDHSAEKEEAEHVARTQRDDFFNPKLNLHSIPPGKFKMGEPGKQKSAEISRAFEVMTTPVTQIQWLSEFGDMPEFFYEENEEDVQPFVVAGKTFVIKPRDPIINVTWYSALEYANRVSKRHGLPEVYDFRDFQANPETSAANGTLEPGGNARIRINAPDADIYQAQGFRLLTDAEYEYLLRNLGKSNSIYPHGIRKEKILDYAWRAARLAGRLGTQPVGTTPKSLVINGAAIHDLIGNVQEWCHDEYWPEIIGGVDPVNPWRGMGEMVVRGDSYHGWGIGDIKAHSRSGLRPNFHASHSTGFRLARTLPDGTVVILESGRGAAR